MKTHNITLFLILILSLTCYGQNLHAQDAWPSENASWHYSYFQEYSTGYIEIVNVGDTVINDTTFSMLSQTQYGYTFPGVLDTSFIGNTYVYYEEGKAYYYKSGRLYTLFDLNADPGDIWHISAFPSNLPVCDTLGQVKVDSISTTIINGQSLKVIFTSAYNGSAWYYSGKIIETIGCTGYFFPVVQTCDLITEVILGPLRCYSDNDLGLYTSNIVSDCKLIPTNLDQNKVKPNLSIFPNPTRGILNIDFDEYAYCEVYNMMGVRLLTTPKRAIDLRPFGNGLYVLYVKDKNGKSRVKKILLEKK